MTASPAASMAVVHAESSSAAGNLVAAREWSAIAAARSQLAATAARYLTQIGLSLRPASVTVADNALRQLCNYLIVEAPQGHRVPGRAAGGNRGVQTAFGAPAGPARGGVREHLAAAPRDPAHLLRPDRGMGLRRRPTAYPDLLHRPRLVHPTRQPRLRLRNHLRRLRLLPPQPSSFDPPSNVNATTPPATTNPLAPTSTSTSSTASTTPHDHTGEPHGRAKPARPYHRHIPQILEGLSR